MKRATTFLFLLSAVPAWAGPPLVRAFVSPDGSDASNCSYATPCRQFDRALAQVAPGGEVVVLASGSFQPFTVTQGVSINAPGGVVAGITVSGTGLPPDEAAVTVQAPSGEPVRLRGLTLRGTGSGTVGILVAGSTAFVEDCVLEGFTNGIRMASGRLQVQDTVVRNGVLDGIRLTGGTATLERVTLQNNLGNGLFTEGARVVVRDSVSSGNKNGFILGFQGQMTLERCLAVHNSTFGIAIPVGSDYSPTIYMTGCTSTYNHIGVMVDTNVGSNIYSAGDNTVTSNNDNVYGQVWSYSPI